MGQVFGGRYELVDPIASGGAGTVWRVWDHREATFRAAKVLRHADSDSLIRFVRESGRRIEHSHVVAPMSWTGEDESVLFTMRLVRGGSVATLLGDYGPLPRGWAVELTRQLLLGLAEIHSTGLVHRDVKPANLLLDATGAARPHLYLSDFGAAALVGAPRLTSVDAVIGTPGYLAPEQARGADPSPVQDVYAAGVVLHQLLTGSAPGRDGALPPLTPRTSEDRALADLAAAMSAPSPRRRPDDAVAALALLDAVPGAHDLAAGADGAEAIEIFDHLAPLPSGWTPRGPDRARSDVSAQANPAAYEDARSQTRILPRDPAPRTAMPPIVWVLAAVGLLLILAAILTR